MYLYYLTSFFFLLISFVVFVYFTYTLYALFSAAPFVPTGKKNVTKMLAFADLKAGETLMDLGSGDGRVLFAAARSGAKSIGIEISPVLFYWSQIIRKLKRAKKVEILRQNLWDTDLSDVDVVSIYFIPGKMPKLMQKIKSEMRPGSRIVSHAFTFPDWQYSKKDGKVYLYIV